MKKYILSLDQGTTSSRAILFDHDGNVVQISQKEFRQIYPKPSWVEHSPNEIFDSQLYVANKCLKMANVNIDEIAAIGITNQRETTIVWDKVTGMPVYNAIVWQDRRGANLCDKLQKQGKAEIIKQKTGLVLDAYFSGTKINWILENVPNAGERAERGELLFGTVDTWLIWNFSKKRSHVTDPSNASRTLLYNIHDGDWDNELLEIFQIPKMMLPEIYPSSSLMAEVDAGFFGKKIPIAGVAGDQQAATFGNTCLKKGMAKNTYGTGCFLLMNTGGQACESENNLLTTIAWKNKQGLTYALEGSVFVGGAVVQWLRDGLNIINDAADVEGLASTVDDNGGLVFVPAFVGLGAPYWDQYARGTMLGITRGTEKGHIARAALEAIAMQTLDIINAMQKDAKLDITTLRVDGGASSNNMLMQYQADLTGLVVERPIITETTALGAAYLAGLAVNFWGNEEELEEKWQLDRRFEPCMEKDKRDEILYHWHRAIERARAWDI